jgi:prepilin-type N-terminal cleavage/methylation domain-containing protein
MIRNLIKRIKRDRKGLTLIELIVSLAILGVVSAFCITTYLNVMTEKRKEADLVKLSALDESFAQILLQKSAFNEAKQLLTDEEGKIFSNKLVLVCPIYFGSDVSKPVMRLSDATITYEDDTRGEVQIKTSPQTEEIYAKLVNHIGKDETIQLDSMFFAKGEYRVYIEFNYTQVAANRNKSITNDNIKITNSGMELLKELDE